MKTPINHVDFKLEDYVAKTNRFADRLFDFKDDRIDKLPFVKGKVIELRDSYFPERGYNLILRLTPTQKTFYVKTPKKSMVKLGVWKKRTNSRHYEAGTLSTGKARELAAEHFESIKYSTLDETAIANMTIREYLETGQYTKDRSKFKIKNNKVKPLRASIVGAIAHGARSILDFKICDVSIGWLDLLKKDWNEAYVSQGNSKSKLKSKDTQRKYFTMINAMMGIWDTAGYIRKNPFANCASDFHDAAKSMGKRQINTINEVSTVELVEYIINELPEDTPKQMHGKIVLATMVLTGVRNCEVYRNFRTNWNSFNRTITIPGEIILKTNDTRIIPIENDLYWDMMERYFSMGPEYYYETDKSFLLPNPHSKTGHASENCTAELWKKVKVRFGIPTNKRAYDLRHTFANNLRKENHDIAQVAYYLGDDIDTVAKYYFSKDPEAGRDAIKRMHQQKKTTSTEVHQEDARVDIDESFMPTEVKRIFGMYKLGKVNNGKMSTADYQGFLKLIKSMPDQISDADSQLWLQIQAA
ncbi:tyrosine-type recombinase/integrase [Pseudoalteromonas umbrosa]|uniref:tyrosine-type recombinase/integrase n=1 Tax=Pseudoalteromonas umbrosa TaxID=3048489 RepID=UPI0024C307E7|nr:site-specific integrase [Pseudoalteromonas sp. B95]MDK1287430.1 site-specific integrase [Pseudoalteromonas sp. B95]